MKNFSKLNENKIKTFNYLIEVTISGNISAESESDAGQLVDDIIDEIDDLVDYRLVKLDEIAESVTESVDNNESIYENLLNDKLPEETISENLLKSINTEIENLNESQKEFIIKQLKNNL